MTNDTSTLIVIVKPPSKLRKLHTPERIDHEGGHLIECVIDGETYPCATIQELDGEQ